MEARKTQRKQVRRNVVLHATGNNLLTGRLRDVSTGGMYIEAEFEAKLRHNTIVRVGFMADRGLRIAKGRLVRRGEDGIALALVDTQPEVARALEDLLGHVAPEPLRAPAAAAPALSL